MISRQAGSSAAPRFFPRTLIIAALLRWMVPPIIVFQGLFSPLQSQYKSPTSSLIYPGDNISTIWTPAITQAHKTKKWSVSGITLPYLYGFWLSEHESEFRKRSSPSSFGQIVKKTPKPRKSSRTPISFWKLIYYCFYTSWSPYMYLYVYAYRSWF